MARRALAHLDADCFTYDLRLHGSMWLRTGGREDNVYAAGIHKRARGRERGREGLAVVGAHFICAAQRLRALSHPATCQAARVCRYVTRPWIPGRRSKRCASQRCGQAPAALMPPRLALGREQRRAAVRSVVMAMESVIYLLLSWPDSSVGSHAAQRHRCSDPAMHTYEPPNVLV